MHRYGVTFLLLFLSPNICLAGDDSSQLIALKGEIEQLKQGQQEMAKTLQAIKDILMGKGPPLDNLTVRVGDSPALGEKTARVTIVEFSDFQCPYCGAYARDTFEKIVDRYVKTGKVRYAIRNFPIEQIHPLAEKAAEAAMCAKEQGKYWEAHTLFFDNQHALEEVIKLQDADAVTVGINTTTFTQCVNSKKYTDLIKRDRTEGVELGVKGTPTFFLGYVDERDPTQIRAVKSLVGAPPLQEFAAAIEDLLKRGSQDQEAASAAK
jgi:protein-disulfide isomerase